MTKNLSLQYIAKKVSNLLSRIGLLETELDSVIDLAGDRLLEIRELERRLEKITCPICNQVMNVVYSHNVVKEDLNPGAPVVREVIMSCSHPPIKK